MGDIGVADGWLVQKNIALQDSHAEFNDVIFIEVQTGSQVGDGEHIIQLKKLEFTGAMLTEQAHRVAEYLRANLAETKVHPEIPVTASFGVATMTQADLDHLLKSADEALYEAKSLGRNCVVAKQ